MVCLNYETFKSLFLEKSLYNFKREHIFLTLKLISQVKKQNKDLKKSSVLSSS